MSTDSTDVGGVTRPISTAMTTSDKVIITDSVTGTRYIITMVNGVLTTEEVV